MRCILCYKQRLFKFQQDPLGHNLPSLDEDKMVLPWASSWSVRDEATLQRLHFYAFKNLLQCRHTYDYILRRVWWLHVSTKAWSRTSSNRAWTFALETCSWPPAKPWTGSSMSKNHGSSSVSPSSVYLLSCKVSLSLMKGATSFKVVIVGISIIKCGVIKIWRRVHCVQTENEVCVNHVEKRRRFTELTFSVTTFNAI